MRAIADPDNRVAAFAIIVRSDLKGKGLGSILLAKMIAYCASRGTCAIEGEALAGNARVLALARRYGFATTPSADGTMLTLRLVLGNGRMSAHAPDAR